MPIIASDLKIRLSGGAANANVNSSLGGAKSSVEVTDNTLHNIFDIVDGTESAAGDIEYRGVYLHNGHGTLTAQNVRVYISSPTTSSADEWDIALAGEGLNGTMETIATEANAPAGETFSRPSTYATGLNMGNIPAGQHYGLWLRRTVNAGAGAIDNNSITINYDCDTAA
jgi:hypothetical protein